MVDENSSRTTEEDKKENQNHETYDSHYNLYTYILHISNDIFAKHSLIAIECINTPFRVRGQELSLRLE